MVQLGAVSSRVKTTLYLVGWARRQWNRRLWRRLTRATEALAGQPAGRPPPSGVHAAQSHQARAEEAQGASWGPLPKGAL